MTRSDPLREGLTEQWPDAGCTQERLRNCAAADAQRRHLGASPPQKKFTRSCSSSVSGTVENHNTHLAPGFILNILVLTPANVVLRGPLTPLTVGCHSLYQMSSQQWNHHSLCGRRTSLCSWGFALPTRAPPGIELWSFRLCPPPVYRVLMEFKPSPFSFLPF